MSDYVTKKEWENYCRQERAKYFTKRDERDRKDHARWKAENDKLLNPPPKPPKPKRPLEPPDISDVKFADYQFARGGLVELETREEDAEIVSDTRVRRKPTVRRKGGRDLVDTYT